MRRVIFLGRKIGAVKAVKFLIDQNIDIAAIVGVETDLSHLKLSKLAKKYKIPFFLDDAVLYKLIGSERNFAEIDLVISYLYPKRIKQPLIKLGKRGCINFHPAPLPDYKSSAGYNIAILEERKEYGVSAHFIDSEKFDSGPIIKVLRFPIGDKDNMIFLYKKTQEKLLELFKETIIFFQTGDEIKTVKNKGGLYLSREQLEALKNVDLEKDSLELINRKIRAFFFPPYSGAKIKVGGEEFTLINSKLLKYLDKLITK